MESKNKPGWKTTEFWGKNVIQIISLLSMFQGLVSPKWGVLISFAIEVLYGAQRTLLKNPEITTLVNINKVENPK